MTSPPTGASGPARWYLVRSGEVLTVGPAALPSGSGPPEGLAGQLEGDPIFLGVDRPGGGEDGSTLCWAQGVAEGAEPPDGARWEPLRRLGMAMVAADWQVAGRAVQLVEWRRTSQYCGRCGTATEAVAGERASRCPTCGLVAYPRLSPAGIVLVRRGREALLARNARFPGAMFSALAGFVEPGESVEEALRREVEEEAGVLVGHLRYVGSQPWPFPHSLMLGFEADWESGEIRVDGAEIAEARWFAAEDLPDLPPSLSIARQLIDRWLAEVS